MWSTFFRDGGWGMYPTATFGFLLVASGILCLLRPERRYVPLVLSLGAVTLGAGLLAFCVGVVKTFHYLPEVAAEDRLSVAGLGCAESLHNVVLALMLIVVTALLGAVAALRAARGARPAAPAA
ncbi:MAG: hypothetical protein IT373_05210 [Polyangiaceae bacterium]|nr:hypothetical protein [Polyangiaceae bacterium]